MPTARPRREPCLLPPSTDSIMLPLLVTCRGADSYCATLAHETTHWTAHESRLARDLGTKRFGSEGYAIDELVAELGAAFLGADLDPAPVRPRGNANRKRQCDCDADPRALLDSEDVFGQLVDARGDAIAVVGAGAEALQFEEVNGALEEVEAPYSHRLTLP